MEMAVDFENREGATNVTKEAEMDLGMMGCDEYSLWSRFNTAIGLLNPVEKCSLSFFGKDHGPDFVIEIVVQNSEVQCSQLEKVIKTNLFFLRVG